MEVNKINDFKINLLNAIEAIEHQRITLMGKDPIFGFITSKYVKCGKKNCKCSKGEKFGHGPYFYLRLEPDYKYKKYLGKKIPDSIEERVEVGRTIKELEKRKEKIKNLIYRLNEL